MSSEKSAKKNASPRAAAPQSNCPDPSLPCETTIDRLVLEIRKFIAASIFFNTRAAESAGLGLTDLQILHLLQLYGPSTPGHLAACSGLSSGGVTVALDRLQKAGFIRREPNPSDRRSLLISLVPTRLRKLNTVYQDVEKETRALLAALPEHDLKTVVRFFETLHDVKADQNSPTHR